MKFFKYNYVVLLPFIHETTFEHLPEGKQQEIQEIVEIIKNAYSTETGTGFHKKVVQKFHDRLVLKSGTL